MDPAAQLFRWGAAALHRRFFHPAGVLATGFLERVAPTAEGLPVESSAVAARISKGAGTPGALPDAIGLALRVPAPHGPWDILLVSAGSGPLGRAVGLRPVASWAGLTMTTLMPLDYQGDVWWLRARLTTPIPGYGLALGSIGNRIERDEVCFELDQAHGTAGFRPLAHLVLTGLDQGHDVSFDPVVNTPPDVHLRPRWLAGLRARAYRGSREGRSAPAATRPAVGPREA
jgi:hypothetical protein